MSHWAEDAIFYHVYPLGFCGAPVSNDFTSEPECRLEKLLEWAGHLQQLGITALYLGPVFESSTHGYDTVDYFTVDRRLGTNEGLKRIIEAFHGIGIKVILDGVFNHVGRDFWAFKDLQQNGEDSTFKSWFSGLDFGRRSPYQDPFSYNAWNGCYNLVKLDLANPDVKDHLFRAVQTWIDGFSIDGLRLDAADCLDLGFISGLSAKCKRLQPDFWLMGEVINGDYGRWMRVGLDSVTNYECYKGLWSSHNDGNLFEIAYSLNRQFGEQGIYKNMPLYNFADNHDVDRVASMLNNKTHLATLYTLLFTMPGIPSIYYGSEWGIEGKKIKGSDANLRPSLDLDGMMSQSPEPDLPGFLSRLSCIRRSSQALRRGNYRQLHVNRQQFAFARWWEDGSVIVAVNTADQPAVIAFAVPAGFGTQFEDLLNDREQFCASSGILKLDLAPAWGRILSSC
jgi:glycosidase